MPLGLAKDSMIKLSELVKEKEDEESTSNHHSSLPTAAVEGQEIMTELPKETDVVDIMEESASSNEAEDPTHAPTATVDTAESDKSAAAAATCLASSMSSFDSERTGGAAHGNSAPAPTSGASVASNDAGSKAKSKGKGSKPASEISYGQYAGFAADYDDYHQYAGYGIGQESFVPTNLQQSNRSKGGFWCCVFPWLTNGDTFDDDDDDLFSDPANPTDAAEADQKTIPARSPSRDEDEVSTGSDMFGERLSDKERQAVLARLRLAQPDVPKSENHDAQNQNRGNGGRGDHSKKGLLKDIIQPDQNKIHAPRHFQPRGILKLPSTMQLKDQGGSNVKDDASVATKSKEDGPRRRSLFPVYDNSKTTRKDLNVSFSPMARVVSVKSHKEMTEEEKGDIWWLKSDYEAFRKTGRMITRAMLEGGSEIWLASNQSWHTPNQNRATTLKNAYSLSQQQQKHVRRDSPTKQEIEKYEQTRDKWWHTFGHSRRGLEHIASIDEGRQRQANVRTAIRAVIDEQRRQKVFHREDAEKLRMVSVQHTSWARDLAAAAAASDQDAVKADFDEESRKSREFYLLKFARTNPASSQAQRTNVPAFMRPMLHGPLTTSRLDANTVSQIRYRKSQKKKITSQTSSDNEPPPTESCVKVRTDDKPSDGSESLAKRAAGFASGEKVANMSAVLSGMGPVPKNVPAVGGP